MNFVKVWVLKNDFANTDFKMANNLYKLIFKAKETTVFLCKVSMLTLKQ